MTDIEGIAGTASGLRQLRLLVALKELLDEATQRAGEKAVEIWRDKILERAGEGRLDYHAFAEDAETMDRYGWISFAATVTGIDSLGITEYGHDIAEEFVQKRQNAAQRFRHVTDDVLKWLYGYYHRDMRPNELSEYLNDPRACYLGVPYTSSELIRAWKRLKEQEYAKSVKDLWGDEVFQPFITTRGYELVESERSVFDPDLSGGGNRTHIDNSVHVSNSHRFNLAHQSSNVNQSVALTTEQVGMIKDKAEALKAILAGDVFGATDELKVQAGYVLTEIDKEAASTEPKSGKMKELFGKLNAHIADVGSNLLIVTANGMIDHVMASLN